MSNTLILGITAGIGTLLAAAGLWYWSRLEHSEPNQWLLLIRDGKPHKAGIGIQVWRGIGDTIARFTSTMQRVTFDAEVLTKDKQKIQVKGFLLWVVSAEDEGPFHAFSRLGIAHKDAKASQDPAYHHALSRPQHHAFRRSVEAAIHKATVAFSLHDLLETPDVLAQQVHADLSHTVTSWGIVLETLELTDLMVSQEELFAHMQAPYIAQSRKEATELQLKTEAEIAQMKLEQEREGARLQAEMSRQRERELAEIALVQAKEAAALAEEQATIEKEKLAHEIAMQEAEAEARHEQTQRDQARQQALWIAKQDAKKTQQEELERLRDLEWDAALQREQRKHEAERTHLEANIAIERDKPVELRDAEQAQHLVTSAAGAIKDLPIKEIRWLSHSAEQGPASLVLDLIDTLRSATLRPPSTTDLD